MESLNKIAVFLILMAIGFVYRRYMDKLEKETEIRNLYIINKELLNKTKKPIMWICVPRYQNARKWASFYSRSNDNLNIPYMYLTIKSILDQCGQSFQICIVDDDSFENLLPNWTPELDKIGDPLREKVRYLGMMQLLHHYGGVVVPPSFLCVRDLEPLTQQEKPFVVENVNYYGDSRFAPDPSFIGAQKECPVIKEFIDYLARMISNDYTAESIFLNDISKWCALRCSRGQMDLVAAEEVGVRNKEGEAIVTEMFFEQRPLKLMSCIYGILIPHEQILKRTALNWLCYIQTPELKSWDTELGSYFNQIY
jgi:hypothetical protein